MLIKIIKRGHDNEQWRETLCSIIRLIWESDFF
jgi:hypothetical protein